MRNGRNVLWWILGIYPIFFVTSVMPSQQEPSNVVSEQSVESNVVLEQSVESDVDTASDDSDMLQSQMTKIMDKIHEVELRLRNYIDQKYLESKKEGDTLREVEIGLRNYIDQKYARHNTEIGTFRDDVKKEIEALDENINKFIERGQNQMNELNTNIKFLQIELGLLNVIGLALFGAFLAHIFQWRQENRNLREIISELQSAAASGRGQANR